jgi:membrane protein
VYVPRLFTADAARYGVIGAVLAMISALFIVMIVVVATAAVGREISDEIERIQRGDRPPDDEIQQEWAALIAEVRLRTEAWRLRAEQWRSKAATRVRREPRSRDQSEQDPESS